MVEQVSDLQLLISIIWGVFPLLEFEGVLKVALDWN